MGKIITFFNHKGGVGKTTLIHNIAFALSDLGKKVLLIDADPQMNLTASMYGLSTSIEYNIEDDNSKWKINTGKYLSIKELIDITTKPADRSIEELKKKNIFRKETGHHNGYIDLITGDINLSETEFDLFGILRNENSFSKHIPYTIQNVIDQKSKAYDFVLIDTSPSSSSSINALFVLTSNYLITPVSPSFFSLQAIDNLSSIFQNWTRLLSAFQTTMSSKGIDIRVKFLGLVVQMAKRYKGGGTNSSNFTEKTESWVKDLNNSVTKFVHYMHQTEKVISKDQFYSFFREELPESSPYIIEKCCDFTPKLRTAAEQEGIPVIHLTDEMSKKHKCDITVENGQYRKSFNAINESYRSIAKALLKTVESE